MRGGYRVRVLKMSHNIENKNGRYSFAFTGSRDQIWHRLGQELPDNASRAEWLAASGFNYHVTKADAFAQSSQGDLIPAPYKFLVREDTSHVLGVATDQYQIVQPADIWEWFENYITVDERFHIDAAGVLSNGERLWATARFNGGVDVAGDRHVARLLMSTSFDATQATRNEATMTRVVCQNTLRLAHSNAKAVVKTRHSTRFQGGQVAKELAQIAQSFAEYKALGDAMAQTAITKEQVSALFKSLLDIPADQPRHQTSTRKLNQFADLKDAYFATQRERNSNRDDVWTALQAVTRYVDHTRSTRNADNDVVGRFDSGTFGSGDAMKSRAMDQLRALLPA